MESYEFQQSCPGCRAVLQLPEEARGKQAQCPGCDATFIAGAEDNSSGHQEPVASTKWEEPVEIRSVSIERITATTWNVLSNRKRPVFAPFLIAAGLVVVLVLLPLHYINIAYNAGSPSAIKWLVFLSPAFLVVLAYASWFAINLAVLLCDDPDSKSKDWRGWFIVRLRPLLFFTLLTAALAASLGVAWMLGDVFWSLLAKSSSVEINLLAGAVVLIGFLVAALSVIALFWPLTIAAYRGKLDGDAFKTSLAMMKRNRQTSLLLALSLVVLLLVGFALFGFGLLITVPVTAVLVCVAERMMTGRTIEGDVF